MQAVVFKYNRRKVQLATQEQGMEKKCRRAKKMEISTALWALWLGKYFVLCGACGTTRLYPITYFQVLIAC